MGYWDCAADGGAHQRRLRRAVDWSPNIVVVLTRADVVQAIHAATQRLLRTIDRFDDRTSRGRRRCPAGSAVTGWPTSRSRRTR